MIGNGVKHRLSCLIYYINGIGDYEYKVMLKGIYAVFDFFFGLFFLN